MKTFTEFKKHLQETKAKKEYKATDLDKQITQEIDGTFRHLILRTTQLSTKNGLLCYRCSFCDIQILSQPDTDRALILLYQNERV